MELDSEAEVEIHKNDGDESATSDESGSGSDSPDEDEADGSEEIMDERAEKRRARKARESEKAKKRGTTVLKGILKTPISKKSGTKTRSVSGPDSTGKGKRSKMWIDDCPTPNTIDKISFWKCLGESASSASVMSSVVMTQMEAQIKDMRGVLNQLGVDVRQRWEGNSFVLARIKEEADAVRNKKNQDRIVILGASNPKSRPKAEDGKEADVEWLRETAGLAVNKVLPGSADGIIFVNGGNTNVPGLPMLDVQMASTTAAIKIRMEFSKKKHEKVDL